MKKVNSSGVSAFGILWNETGREGNGNCIKRDKQAYLYLGLLYTIYFNRLFQQFKRLLTFLLRE